MTKLQLAQMLFIEDSVQSVVIDSSGNSHIGIVQAVTRESGSGYTFIVRMHTEYSGDINIFVRTID